MAKKKAAAAAAEKEAYRTFAKPQGVTFPDFKRVPASDKDAVGKLEAAGWTEVEVEEEANG